MVVICRSLISLLFHFSACSFLLLFCEQEYMHNPAFLSAMLSFLHMGIVNRIDQDVSQICIYIIKFQRWDVNDSFKSLTKLQIIQKPFYRKRSRFYDYEFISRATMRSNEVKNSGNPINKGIAAVLLYLR